MEGDHVDHLIQRILFVLSRTLMSESKVDEFDIIPMPQLCQRNKCPVVQVGNKVGLESWCVKHVFTYCYNKVMKSQKIIDTDSDAKLMVTVLLLLAPDIQHAWNLRKQWFLSNMLNCQDELEFTELILKRKPKCEQLYTQRKWLLKELRKRLHASSDDILASPRMSQIVDHELEICEAAASRYPNNYHAWTHRIWTLQQLNSSAKIFDEEFERTELWCRKHVSDHSGLHYRQFIMKCISQQTRKSTINSSSCVNRSLLKLELSFCSELIKEFPGHEALWCHRRFVIYHSFKLDETCDEHVRKRSKLDSRRMTTEDSVGENFLKNERLFLEKCKDRHHVEGWQMFLINRHEEWLEKFIS